MPKSVNKVFLLGNVGQAPEVKYTPSGVAVATFSIACNERFKDKSGEWQDKTEWINCKAWQRNAEIVGEYVQKGSRLFIEGKLTTETWDDRKSGEKKYKTLVVISDLVLMDSRNGESPANAKPARHVTDEEIAQGLEITDEDIPF